MKKDEDKTWVYIGRCTRPHGLKGGSYLSHSGQDECVVSSGHIVQLKSADNSIYEWEVSKIQKSGKLIIYFKEIEDRTALEKYLPLDLYLKREDFPPLPQDQYYWSDLLGLKVLDAKDNKEIGVVEDTYSNGVQTILSIRLANRSLIEIPYIKNFVQQVDLDHKTMTITNPEFLE